MSLADHVPAWMLRDGPWGLAVWQWIALAVTVVVGYIAGRIAAFILTRVVGAMTRRTRTAFDDELLSRLRSPLRGLLSVGAMRALLPLIELHASAQRFAHTVLVALFAMMVVWAAVRAIDVVTARLTTASWAAARPTSRALISLLARIAKVIVVVIAGIAFLSGLGIPVASLLAGLGIGGIALAFGAQKTVENLFGAVAIGIDQPLREGDFVKVEDTVLGTVEAVGLRSTRFRTLDRTIVTLPNGKLADMRVETYAPRDRCRLATSIGVVYSTTADQLKSILSGFESALRSHPQIWPDDIVVRFSGFGQSSLDIEVMAWFKTADWAQFRVYRQEVLIAFMEVVERAGSSFAFPTRTVHLMYDGSGGTPWTSSSSSTHSSVSSAASSPSPR